MKTHNAHTPGWKVWQLSPESDEKQRFIIVSDDCETEITGIIEKREHAELICRAVNSHDELLELLKETTRFVTPHCSPDDVRDGTTLIGRITAAITKATLIAERIFNKSQGL